MKLENKKASFLYPICNYLSELVLFMFALYLCFMQDRVHDDRKQDAVKDPDWDSNPGQKDYLFTGCLH